MDLINRRKEIRRIYFSTGGLITVSILGIIGLFFIFFSGILNVENSKMLYDCISKSGIIIIFGLFFLIAFIYCWVLFFINIILKPKKEILYLYKKNNKESYFLNQKGKKFVYDESDKEENHYYYVLKTHDYIYEVLEECSDSLNNWTPSEKKSYWIGIYTPIQNYDSLLVLPVIYVILLIGILSIIMAKGYQKIYGLILSIVPIYVIIYDLIYKVKLRKSSEEEIDDTPFINSYKIFQKIISVIVTSIICIIFIITFLSFPNFISKLIFSPFLGCALCAEGLIISKALDNYRLEKIFYKGYIVIFLIFWFGFLGFWTIEAFKQGESLSLVFFLIPFWLVGIYVLYKKIIKK